MYKQQKGQKKESPHALPNRGAPLSGNGTGHPNKETKEKQTRTENKKDNDEKCIVIIGKTGSGKSTLGNMLLGKTQFRIAVEVSPAETNKAAGRSGASQPKSRKVSDTSNLSSLRPESTRSKGAASDCPKSIRKHKSKENELRSRSGNEQQRSKMSEGPTSKDPVSPQVLEPTLAADATEASGQKRKAVAPTTRQADVAVLERPSYKIKILDTPDPGTADRDVGEEVSKWKGLVSSSPDVILLTVRADASHAVQDYLLYQKIKSNWGDASEFRQKLVIAFTFADCVDKPEDAVKKNLPEIQKLLEEANGRHVLTSQDDEAAKTVFEKVLAFALGKTETFTKQAALVPEARPPGKVATREVASKVVASPKVASKAVPNTEVASKAVAGTKVTNKAVPSAEIAGKAVDSAEVASKAGASAEVASKAGASAEVASKAGASTEVASKAGASTEVASKAGASTEVASKAGARTEVASKAGTSRDVTNRDVTGREFVPKQTDEKEMTLKDTGTGRQESPNERRILIMGTKKSGTSSLFKLLQSKLQPDAKGNMFTSTACADTSRKKEEQRNVWKVMKMTDCVDKETPEADIRRHIDGLKEEMSRSPGVILYAVCCDARYVMDEIMLYQRVKGLWGDTSEFCQKLVVVFIFPENLGEPKTALSKFHPEILTLLRDAGDRYIHLFDQDIEIAKNVMENLISLISGKEQTKQRQHASHPHGNLANKESVVEQKGELAAFVGETSVRDEKIPDERRVLLIGKTGNGKSTVGNLLLGSNQFSVGTGMSTETTDVQTGHSAARADKALKVVDTPDLINEEMNETDMRHQVKQWKLETASNPDVILLAVRCDVRFTSEEFELYQKIRELWEDRSQFCQKLVVAFTFGETLDEDIQEVLQDVGPELKEVLADARNRFVIFSKTDRRMTETALNKIFSFCRQDSAGGAARGSGAELYGESISNSSRACDMM